MRSRFYEDGPTEHLIFKTPELFYNYLECLDVVVSALNNRFQRHDHSLYANMEQLLINACSKADYSHELHDVTEFFKNCFNKSEIEIHL